MCKMNTEIKNIKSFLKSDDYKKLLNENMLGIGGDSVIIENYSVVKHFKSVKSMYHFLKGFYSFMVKHYHVTIADQLITDTKYMDLTPIKCEKGYDLIFN